MIWDGTLLQIIQEYVELQCILSNTLAMRFCGFSVGSTWYRSTLSILMMLSLERPRAVIINNWKRSRIPMNQNSLCWSWCFHVLDVASPNHSHKQKAASLGNRSPCDSWKILTSFWRFFIVSRMQINLSALWSTWCWYNPGSSWRVPWPLFYQGMIWSSSEDSIATILSIPSWEMLHLTILIFTTGIYTLRWSVSLILTTKSHTP